MGKISFVHSIEDLEMEVAVKRKWMAYILVGGVLAMSATALGKTGDSIVMGYDKVWSAAVRLIRVDRGWELIDKDKEAGYILFKFAGDNAITCRSSVELVKESTKGSKEGSRVKVIVGIPCGSSLEEHGVLTDLFRKVREE